MLLLKCMVEMSLLQNVKSVFDAAIKVVLQPPKQKKRRRKSQRHVLFCDQQEENSQGVEGLAKRPSHFMQCRSSSSGYVSLATSNYKSKMTALMRGGVFQVTIHFSP
ncbi:hypothetical protein HAX54_022483 [Datura stramonium]|uniref:Uncharacterized protein n=1 Tax=Datura stramonium TaxID=4076 RepID=A0ABS8UWU2_DATST|nr:hypothetical protein [Datura stramonium]